MYQKLSYFTIGILCVYQYYDECYPNIPSRPTLFLTESDVRSAIVLIRYYLHEYYRLSSENFGTDINNIALELFEELNNNPDKWQTNTLGIVSQSAVTRNIDQLKSSKGKLRRDAFKLLVEHRYLIFDDWQDGMSRKRQQWIINPTIKKQ